MKSMIELDIKIRAKNDENLKFLIDAMTDSLGCANSMGHVDVQFSASTNGDTMTLVRKETIKTDSLDEVKKKGFTPIEEFIVNSAFSKRVNKVLFPPSIRYGNPTNETPPFKYAEDITEQIFKRLRNAGKKSWLEVEAELKRQNIKY